MYIGATVTDPKFTSAPCATVNASSIPDVVRKRFQLIKDGDEPRSPGYNAACKCYHWGYRPEILNVLRGLGGVMTNDWLVCLDPQTKCPTPAPCPTCGKPPPCNCPTCPAPVQDASGLGGKFGPALGVALAAAIVGAGGFYMWKKLKKR